MPPRREADREQIDSFVQALFRHADQETFVSLRAFYHERGKPPAKIQAVKLDGNGSLDRLAEIAATVAGSVARYPEATVFAPPLGTFADAKSATEKVLANGLALSIECDANAVLARQRLEGILGPATAVVESGGMWLNAETGQREPKLHVHWRLAEPTRTADEHARLKEARLMATVLVGGDPSNVPMVHPLRWPGSWHLKGEPKLAKLMALDADREIDLDEAFELLEGASMASGARRRPAAAEPEPTKATKRRGPFQQINDEALRQLEKWVPIAFPGAACSNGTVWRVSSKLLGRDNEEDLSLSPEGIVDFGIHDLGDAKRGRRTPITLVAEYGARVDPPVESVLDAACWLAQQLGIDLELGLTDDDLAREFEALHGQDWRYVARFGRWYEWTGQRWREDAKLGAFTVVRGFLRERAKRGPKEPEKAKEFRKSLLHKARVAAVADLCRSNETQAALAEEWDSDPWLLGTPDGVVNLRTGQLRKATREDRITMATAVVPAPSGTKPVKWTEFLHRIFKHDPSLVDYMQRLLGYALCGDKVEEVFGFAFGTGQNGKGTLFNTSREIMGDYGCEASLNCFVLSRNERHPTELARLRGKRLVMSAEVAEGSTWDEVKIKQVTGRDPIAANFMRQDMFEFDPEFLLMVSGNHKPTVRSANKAMQRRLHVIPFEQEIPDKERDTQLRAKLKAEGPAILRWMIDGCLEWQKHGLQPPGTVESATEDYLSSENVLGDWFEECCRRDFKALTPFKRIYESYSRWAESNKLKAFSSKRLSKMLEERGFRKARMPDSQGAKAFSGLDVIDPPPKGDEPDDIPY